MPLKSIAFRTRPPEHSTALVWLRNQSHASTLAVLARNYLQPADSSRIEHLLRHGRHGRAVTRFCERFSQRCFPLDYPWTGDADGRLLAEVAGGIQHEGFGDDWEEYGDLPSLRPVFLLSWGLMEDPYAPMRDEFLQDEVGGEDRAEYRLCDQAREIVARLAEVPAAELFGGVPVDGFSAGHLRMRLQGTRWEPLLWAAPWLWRLSGNPFLDQSPSEGAEPQAWMESTVFRLSAKFREAVRLMHAIDAFDIWLCQAPTERARAAVQAACGPPCCERISTLIELPLLRCQRGGSC